MPAIPESHRDLLELPLVVSLGTINPDGSPQVMPMWVDLDGDEVRINTAAGRQKYWNMLHRPQVSVLAIDPDDGHRFLEIRGEAVLADEDANAHADALIVSYQGAKHVPTAPRTETRVVFRIRPVRVLASG